MKTIKVYHYDAFSHIPNMGNPAGVVMDGEKLSDDDMQKIAEKVGFNETAFPLKSEKADLKIRFFTPGHEINLCGHATMATIYALKTKGLLGDQTEWTIETKAGVLSITLDPHLNKGIYITMQQATPQFQEFNGSLEKLASAMGIQEEDIETNLPTLYGSTGIWTLLVPIKNLSTFKAMKPNNKHFPEVLQEMPKASVHPFCLETYDVNAHMHARHFSSPYSGTIEDPVTGTASGVMGAYYANFLNKEADSPLNLLIEQGHEMGRDGRIHVTVTLNNDQYGIEVKGTAVHVKDFEVSI
ncbi:PhzF family phenazine biosynthesis protein [Paenibacillus andongensis]|uniref:PhzF family phenazine biosynthesis protein n=1 Tax=Paenibacillus andongensis TaxID=2975482 RepID=UPI0021BB4A29|nr:PhzF family phenazine biosynthesis protein [Paenibacillus andongensis]